VALLSLALGIGLSALVALAGTAKQAEAAFTEKVVFISNRTTGTGVNNPTGDVEIFRMNPDGTGLRQLTFNEVSDVWPTLSPDGTKIAYTSFGVQASNPEGDQEVYVMNALDGKAKKNLSNNGVEVLDSLPSFSPDSQEVAYQSSGVQASNPEGDSEVYRMNAADGTGKRNLSNNGNGAYESSPVFSPSGQKVAYESHGAQASNPEGDYEVYIANALDGTGRRNLTNNGASANDLEPDFSPDGTRVAYKSNGTQTSNPEGDEDVYRMNALDGTGKRNLSNNGGGIHDFSIDWGVQAT
jgi:Tol biopolymer transport system component